MPESHIHVHVHCGEDGELDSTTAAINALQETFMAQIDDLRAAIAQVGVDLGEAIARVEARVAALGDPDPDLTADIAALQDVSARLDGLQASPAEPEPTEPGPNPNPNPVEPTEPTEPEPAPPV